MILLLQSISTETGANFIVLADINQLFLEEPMPIDLDAYVQWQLEDVRRSYDAVSGQELSGPIETQAISINGIGGTQIRHTVTVTEYEGAPQMKFLNYILIGDEDDPATSCGSIAYMVQGTYFADDTAMGLNVIEKALGSFRVLPTASGGLDSCSDRTELSLLD